MIYESYYWKTILLKHADALEKRLEQRAWRASSYAKVELDVMLGCYILRRLAESKKISGKLFQQPVSLRRYPATGKAADILNNHRIHELYGLRDSTRVTKPLSFVANQIIHSFVFMPVFKSQTTIYGVAFTSDLKKATELYMAPLESFVQVFRQCGHYYASSTGHFRAADGSVDVIFNDDR